MRVAIVGSRTVAPSLEQIAKHLPDNVTGIISGGARGADTQAEEYARVHGLECTVFLPDYKSYGRGAPLKRNKTIVQEADFVLAFWDGKSRGTMHTVKEAKKLNKPAKVVEWMS